MSHPYRPFVCLCLTLLPLPLSAPGRTQAAVAVTSSQEEDVNSGREVCSPWRPCSFTTYANHFEGRRTASGARFSHGSRYVACRLGEFRTIVRFRYKSENGNWHESRGILADRGGLPLHRKNCPQYDVPKLVARELGLYRKGGDRSRFRNGEYQFVREVDRQQASR